MWEITQIEYIPVCHNVKKGLSCGSTVSVTANPVGLGLIYLFVCLSTHSPSHVCERIWTLIKGKHPPEKTLIHPAEFHSPFRRLSFMCSSFVVVVVVVVVVWGCQTLRVRRLSDRPRVESEQSLSSSSFNVKHLPCIIQPFLFNDKNV